MAQDSKEKPKKSPERRDDLSHPFPSAEAFSAAWQRYLQQYKLIDEVIRGATPNILSFLGGDPATREKQRELERQVADLKRRVDEQTLALEAEKHSSQEKQRRVEELNKTLAQLSEKERLSFLLSRVNHQAQRVLMESVEFQNRFLTSAECNTFVMSVDIRRSTELMLRARRADQFAEFITRLCTDLMNSVLECYGVFDKFTGDGILAFFPDFFTGPDAGYYVLVAADRCHKAFQTVYHKYRAAFNAVLKDTGLGIGIDYGAARLVQMAGGMSVVGPPVVYACRMAGAPAGQTLLNQPAYERISERFSASCFFRETDLEIKHEGTTLAYDVTLSKQAYQPKPPDWCAQPDASHIEGEAAQKAPS